MKVNPKEDKIKLSELEFGGTFRIPKNINNYLKVDLSEEKVFQEIVAPEDTIVCVTLLTGKVILLEGNLIVERTNLEAQEV